MWQLKNRKDGFRIILPKEFLHPEIEKKYSNVISKFNGFYNTPIDFLNETIQKVEVLGFNNAVITQEQQLKPFGYYYNEEKSNDFPYPSYENTFRNAQSYLSLTDMTLNIEFKHTLGYVNYFMLYENFLYLYSRETDYNDMIKYFKVDLFNVNGEILCTILLENPMINAMDMLSFDYTQPIAQSSSFKIEFKYSNIKIDFINTNPEEK